MCLYIYAFVLLYYKNERKRELVSRNINIAHNHYWIVKLLSQNFVKSYTLAPV